MDSGFEQFFSQIPTGLIIMLCGSGIVLIVSAIAMISARNRRMQTALMAMQAQPYSIPAARRPMVTSMSNALPSDYDDMPDVDSLLNTDTLTTEVPAVRMARSGTFSVRTVDGETLETVEVLTVLRDVTDGGLLIQIGDQIVRNPPALADSEFKRRFNGTISELAKSLSIPKPAAIPAPRPAPAVVVTNTDPLSEPSLDDLTDLPVQLPNEPTRSTNTTRAVGVAPGDLPKFTLSETPMNAKPLRRVPKPTGEPIPEINVGGSVEAYLQHRLSLTPEFAGRSIHIRTSPKGGIVIDVEGKQYEAVGDIEDIDAKLFLAETIEEWQSRQ